MKKTFHAISEMRGPFYSGFGWNDELKCITVEKDVIDDWVKILSHYDDISYVFKRDRVTEGRSETFVDVGSNVPFGYKGFSASDDNDMENPARICSQSTQVVR
ncbi:retrotransposon protein [Cucumis melo var. makuwa]|uniref:Retrotransposon protein n=1 Tax=Cucumis melo var. makuwa TaxID=1194695 RepID=A0A5D3BXG2_CUCMM|nr:retrotransposon protein [Cucumis melo var. makuwa]